jgi:hypothetical protein
MSKSNKPARDNSGWMASLSKSLSKSRDKTLDKTQAKPGTESEQSGIYIPVGGASSPVRSRGSPAASTKPMSESGQGRPGTRTHSGGSSQRVASVSMSTRRDASNSRSGVSAHMQASPNPKAVVTPAAKPLRGEKLFLNSPTSKLQTIVPGLPAPLNARQLGETVAEAGPRPVIRIITPHSSQQIQEGRPLLYKGGEPVPLATTTLRQLKVGIAEQLGISNLQLPPPSTAADIRKSCNCAFATSIAENGLWEMLRCRTNETSHEDCDYPHTRVRKDVDCPICLRSLREACEDCQSDQNPDCPLCVNAGCQHTFHYHCYRGYSGDNCPGGCNRSKSLILSAF